MQTIINAWKRRIARRVLFQAAADMDRLHNEYCAPWTQAARGSHTIQAEFDDAARRYVAASRRLAAI